MEGIMRHGFIKVAAVTPKIKVADPFYNQLEISRRMHEAVGGGAKLIVFPELCLTGYTCSDLFSQELLLEGAYQALDSLIQHTEGSDALVFVGLPFEKDARLYNVAAVIQGGELLAFIPKGNIPGYGEFYEQRHFEEGNREPVYVTYGKWQVPFGMNILLEAENIPGLAIGVEICEDLWAPDPPSTSHALAGAGIIVNLSASNEYIGKDSYRNMLVLSTSARLLCGYVYVSAGEGESSTDLVFGGHKMIGENGVMVSQSKRFRTDILYGDLDIKKIIGERRRRTTFCQTEKASYRRIPFKWKEVETKLSRTFDKAPFVPSDQKMREERCEEVLSIQSMGLKKRLEHTECKRGIIGISGGLDSTLALLVTVRAFDLLSIERKQIIGVTMPCFGTTDRTYKNACKLINTLGVQLKEIDIKETVELHFRDIEQDKDKEDLTYENSQARERTQVLMDMANQMSGLVIGTGDMSELALGWATYNGDHMSMYGVNAGVPKTLVRHLVAYYGDTCKEKPLRDVLYDILDTPVSPELLPPKNGDISQKTEETIGPYELHDFYLYYMLRFGFSPEKIYRIAQIAFAGIYEKETILKWMKVFYNRFFSQQFKRSCLPDGPKVGSVSLSPRGDLRMPSDASCTLWQRQLEQLK